MGKIIRTLFLQAFLIGAFFVTSTWTFLFFLESRPYRTRSQPLHLRSRPFTPEQGPVFFAAEPDVGATVSFPSYDRGAPPNAPDSEKNLPLPRKKRILICAKVSDELPFLLEWIEFHRLQGVEKFALYPAVLPLETYSHAALGVDAIRTLYEQMGLRDVIDVLPTIYVNPDGSYPLWTSLNQTLISVHRLQQQSLISHCLARYKDQFEYIAHIDVDEFLYSTPPNSSLYSVLTSQTQSGLQQLSDLLSPVDYIGYYVEPTHFGSNGMIFDFHTQLVFDTASGETQVVFDPRDSDLYHLQRHKTLETNWSRSPVSGQDKETSTANTAGDHSGQITLSEKFPFDWLFRDNISTSSMLASDRDILRLSNLRIGEQIADHLNRMQTSSTQADAMAARKALEELIDRIVQAVYPSTMTDRVEETLAPESDFSIRTEIARIWQDARVQKNIFDGLADHFPDALSENARQNLTENIRRAWQPYFPLITDIQRTTYDPTLAKFIKVNSSSIPSWMTTLGKSVYRTDILTRPDIARRLQKSHGCLAPWVHTCAYEAGLLRKIRTTDGILRLDHHQFRSLQRRTSSLPSWRGGPYGYAVKPGFRDIQRLSNVVVDATKARLSRLVRERIFSQFEPFPKFLNYSRTSEIGLTPYGGILSTCSAFELVSKRQVPCPREYPYVRFGQSGLVSPTTYLPYFWCTREPYKENETKSDEFWELRERERMSAFEERIMCPGFPEVRCCNSVYIGNASLWDHPIASLASDVFDFRSPSIQGTL